MDQNTRDVLVVAIPVLGTLVAGLGGVALGRWLEHRQRHDQARREAYVNFLTASRMAMGALEGNADAESPGEALTSKEDAQALLDSFGRVQLIGDEHALIEAERIWLTIQKWMNAPPQRQDPERWAKDRRQTDDAISAFMRGARKDLGLKP